MRLLLLFLLLVSFWLSAISSDTLCQRSRFERSYVFRWDSALVGAVKRNYGVKEKLFDRAAQLFAESAFNPKATSDFAGWRKAKIDTVEAIERRMGAAGIAQFIWPTAKSFGAKTITPSQAVADTFAQDIFNPFWGIDAMSRYMKKRIEVILLTTSNNDARVKLLTDKRFMELCATASYNTGEDRIRDRLNKFGGNWELIKYSILKEPREYAEKIARISDVMKEEKRWRGMLDRYWK